MPRNSVVRQWSINVPLRPSKSTRARRERRFEASIPPSLFRSQKESINELRTVAGLWATRTRFDVRPDSGVLLGNRPWTGCTIVSSQGDGTEQQTRLDEVGRGKGKKDRVKEKPRAALLFSPPTPFLSLPTETYEVQVGATVLVGRTTRQECPVAAKEISCTGQKRVLFELYAP